MKRMVGETYEEYKERRKRSGGHMVSIVYAGGTYSRGMREIKRLRYEAKIARRKVMKEVGHGR